MEAVELVQGLASVIREYNGTSQIGEHNGSEEPTDSSDEDDVWILRNPTVKVKMNTRVEVRIHKNESLINKTVLLRSPLPWGTLPPPPPLAGLWTGPVTGIGGTPQKGRVTRVGYPILPERTRDQQLGYPLLERTRNQRLGYTFPLDRP